jgi:transcriptional regulator with XRE-family HTH domain
MRAARERAGKSQAQIADELGVTQPLIFKWEHDRSHPRTEDVRRVARVYGIKPDLLIPAVKS